MRYNDYTLALMEQEIYSCQPVDKEKPCYTTCQFTESSRYYRWCYIDSTRSSYRTCTCKVRSSVLKFLIMKKREMMGLLPPRALTEIEICFIVLVAAMAMGAMIYAMVRFAHHRNRQQPNDPPLVADILPHA